ncbi:RICIN domain-containing protein [Kribbella sp. NPDC003505]|uniref:RICIN domain-containing protein n=1 Tax=Kribbella sp. NPDC003505 TaxID=3154448 RepID=UPI0033AEFCD6
MAAVAIVASTVVSAGQAQASVPPENTYTKIRNWEGRGILATPGPSNGAKVVQWDDDGSWATHWRFVKKVDADGDYNDRYWIVNRESGRCAGISGGALYNGAGAIQWDCNWNAWSNYWYVRLEWVEDGTPLYRLVNVWSGMCLAIPAGSKTLGIQAIQWSCANDPDQLWDIAA